MTATLVVGAAPTPGCDAVYRRILAGAANVVAADAAGEWCAALGRVPDAVVGDFDSAEAGAPDRLRALGAEVEVHPADKDASDLDLAARLALRRFAAPLTFTACFSDRFDHTLSSFGTMLRAGTNARAVEPGWSAWAVHPGCPVEVPTHPGDSFGVVAVVAATGVEVRGGRWELGDARLDAFDSRAISNRATGGTVRVATGSGALLLFITEAF